MSDLIAAVATGWARTGIGILRMSGDGCIAAASGLFRPSNGRPLTDVGGGVGAGGGGRF